MKSNLTSLKQVQEALQAKSALAHTVFEEAGDDLDFSKVKCLGTLENTAKVEKIKALNAELGDLHADYEELSKLTKSRHAADQTAGFTGETPKTDPEAKAVRKSIGQLFTESLAFKQKHVAAHIDVDVKTVMTASAGWDPDAPRIGRTELYPLRKLSVFDQFPIYTTEADTIKYMKETTHTNNAAERAENTAAGEAALALTETSDEVENVSVWLPVSDRQLEDVGGMTQYLNNRLSYMVKNRADSQLLTGNGTTPNLWGANNLSSVQTQAKSSDPTPDAIFKGITKVRGVSAGTGFAEPSHIDIHPNDWQDIRLLRTADGIYIFGSPSEPGPERLWGVQVVVTPAQTENQALIGDFQQFAGIFLRRGMTFKVTDSHDKYFIYGVQAIKAEIRMAAVYFRDSAFCTVTGI